MHQPSGNSDSTGLPAAQELKDTPELKRNLTIDLGSGVTMDFVLIRPGTFTMGSVKSGFAYAKPIHKVALTKPFYLGSCEVTQEQWEKVMGGNPSRFKGTKNPVETVSWDDCQKFVVKLKEKVPDKTFRLPTEAEWEYACRGGTAGDYCYGDGEGSLGEYAWHVDNAANKTHPVGKKKPNAWGLYDMHGNVDEWCADLYGDYPATAVDDPQGSSSGSYRVLRGGSLKSTAIGCGAAYRACGEPSKVNTLCGLRLVCCSISSLVQRDVQGDGRIWTDTKGRQLRGELVSVTMTDIVLRIGTKKTSVPLSILSEADKKVVAGERVRLHEAAEKESLMPLPV